MPQWLAVMKYGLASFAVLFTSEPEQNRVPPVEITATARSWSL